MDNVHLQNIFLLNDYFNIYRLAPFTFIESASL